MPDLRTSGGAVLIALMDRLVPSRARVVLVSHPDIDDNVTALLRNARATELPVTVLAGNPAAARDRAKALGLKVSIVKRNSARGLWSYLRSSVCVSTHGLFGSRQRPRSKRHLGLWHGEYIKAVGRVAGEPTHTFDEMYVSGELSRMIRSAETGIDPQRIHVTGVPRNDLLRAEAAEVRPVVIWAPTYRASTVGARRSDGDAEAFSAFVTEVLAGCEGLLAEHDAELWLRLHPSASGQIATTSRRVSTADDAFLASRGLTLYDALGRTRALITDFSSLWVDYLHLDRPVIGAAPDLDSYKESRGLLLQPYDWWFPGPLCRSVDETVAAIGDVLQGHDTHAEHRRLVSSILISPEATSPTDALWREILEGSVSRESTS